MFKTISISRFFLFTIVFFLTVSTFSDSASAGTYTCIYGRYDLWYPDDWERIEVSGADMAFAHPTLDSFRENINVISTHVTGVRDEKEYVLDACNEAIEEIRGHDPTANVISQPSAGKVNCHWAATYVIDIDQYDTTIRLSQTIIVSEGYSYAFIITCAALPFSFNDYQNTFSRCINSFQVLNEPEEGFMFQGLIIMLVGGALIGGLAGMMIFVLVYSKKRNDEKKEEKPIVTNIIYKPPIKKTQPEVLIPQPVKVKILSQPQPPPPPPPPPDS